MPRNDHPDHAARLLTVICDESPDLVIPARDHDVDSLAALVAIHRALASKTTVGAFPCAEIMRDKYLSWQFASRHHLAFAETLPTGRDLDAIALANFIAPCLSALRQAALRLRFDRRARNPQPHSTRLRWRVARLAPKSCPSHPNHPRCLHLRLPVRATIHTAALAALFNQAPRPTPMSVTPPAGQEARQP